MSTVRRSGGLLLGACAVHDHHLSSGDWVANSQGRQLPGKVLALSRAAAWRAREQTVISRNTAELRHWPDMAFQIDLGEEIFDVAIAGGICHLFDAASNRLLLKRVHRALAPSGKLSSSYW